MDTDTLDIGHLSDDPALSLIRSLPLNLEKGPWVAGGAAWRIAAKALGLPVPTGGDIDVFVANPYQARIVLGFVDCDSIPIPSVPKVIGKSVGKGFTERLLTFVREENSIEKNPAWVTRFNEPSPLMRLQVITHRSMVDVKDLFNSFDFRLCAIATDGWNLISAPGALQDLREGVLRHTHTMPIKNKTRVRAVKYVGKYGFKPEPGLLSTVIDVDNTDFDDQGRIIVTETDEYA